MVEIVCLESLLAKFGSNSWSMAREYLSKIVKDIELGYKKWETLDPCIDSTAWCYAQKMVGKPNKGNSNQSSKGQNIQKLCTSYDTFRKEGCSYENSDPGESCIYLHHCSNCRQRGFPGRRHKAINCREGDNSTNSNITSNSSAAPVVTSS